MAGPLTQTAIAAIIFGIIMGSGIYMLQQFTDPQSYGVTLENNFSALSAYNSAAQNATGVYDNSSQGASINSASLGSAQLQGLISAEQTKASYYKIFTSSVKDFFQYFPMLSSISIAIIAIIAVLVVSMVYRAIRGVDP